MSLIPDDPQANLLQGSRKKKEETAEGNILSSLPAATGGQMPAVPAAPTTPAATALPTPAQPAPSSPVDESQLRSFADIPATRRRIYEAVYNTASNLPPVSNDRYVLRLRELSWSDPETFTRKQHKEAVLSGTTLARRLRGTWELLDAKTGQVLDSRRGIVAKVPYLTDHGTFVIGGVEYSLRNQQRLRPGVYARIKENGEIEAHVNVVENGPSHRYWLDPVKGIFYVKIGQANIPAAPLLRALGVTDEEMRQAWGEKLYQANAEKESPAVLNRILEKFRITVPPDKTPEQAIREAMARIPLDPEVTKRTLGRPYDHIDKFMALDTTRKLLAISRGEAEPDDRDHLAFQVFMGPEELFEERLKKDRAGVRRKMLWKISRYGNLSRMGSSPLQEQVDAAILESGLGQCYDAETEVLTRRGFVPWPQVTEDDEFACCIDKRVEYHKAEKLFVYDYDGELLGCSTEDVDYLVTPNHRVWCRGDLTAQFVIEKAQEIHGRARTFRTALYPLADGESPTAWKIGEGDDALTVPFDSWVELLAYYISWGWVCEQPLAGVGFRVPEGRLPLLAELLSSLHLSWVYDSTSGNIVFVRSAPLAAELARCGINEDVRQVPRYCFSWARSHIDHLLAHLMVKIPPDSKASGRRDPCISFTVKSALLAQGLQELGVHCGMTASVAQDEDGQWRVYLITRSETRVPADGERFRKDNQPVYYRQKYQGKVYCAEVPGGLLYVRRRGRCHWSGNSLEEINPAEILDKITQITRMGEGGIPSYDAIPDEARSVQPSHYGFIDPIRTPESFRTGVDVYAAIASRKGPGGRIFSKFINARTGKEEWKSPQEVADSVVTFPGALETFKGKRVPAVVRGKLTWVERDKVDLIPPSFESVFSPLANLVPLKSMAKGHRMAMASRMTAQALPLNGAEAPLVQTAVPGTNEQQSFEELYGELMGAMRAKRPGKVLSVSPDAITVQYSDGTQEELELYKDFPYNRKTGITQTPVVQAGQRFTAGQLLAKSNFTDNTGATALGVNARVAYMPWGGYNFEDAIVISESMAKRLTSQHIYQHDLEVDDSTRLGRNTYISIFPSKFTNEQLKNVDELGLIRPGTVVKYGDPLILGVRQRQYTANKVHKKGEKPFMDASVTWEHDEPGIVTDVVMSKTGPVVVVKTEQPMKVGDKMSGRYGDKGVVAAIVPDEQMPRDSQGRPFEVLANPLGLISRTNPAQLAEAKLGEIARKLGRPVKIEDFRPDRPDLSEHIRKLMLEYGVPDTEEVYDPVLQKKIPDIFTGTRFFMKLHHTAECFDDQTEVLTSCGWMNWSQVADDQLLATVDNGRLMFERPLQVVRIPVKSQLMYGYRSRDVEYLVTPEHKLLVRARSSRDFVLREAELVHGNVRLSVAQFTFTPEPYESLSPQIFLDDLAVGWSDYGELVGWALVAGSVHRSGDRRRLLLRPQNNVERNVRRIEQLARRMRVQWVRLHQYGRPVGVYIETPAVVNHLWPVLQRRRVPRLLANGMLEARRAAISAMLAECGRKRHGRAGSVRGLNSFLTAHRELADDFQELALRSGMGVIVERYNMRSTLRRNGKEIKKVNKGMYACRILPKGVKTAALWQGHGGEFYKRTYSGYVYCATMRTGLLIVRRNGKPMVSGNSKSQGRSSGGYTAEELPAKGGETGAKRLSLLDLNALLSHGAVNVLRDAKIIRGQRNDEFWLQFMAGYTPRATKVPMVYEKFLAQLQGAGINVLRDGAQLHIMALTDRDVDALAGNREVTNGETGDLRGTLRPVKGGLFDETLTGGHNGNRWAAYRLTEPMPNPVMEEPIRRLLGLTEKQFLDVLAGRKELDGRTGPQAIAEALRRIDVDKEIERARNEMENSSGNARDMAVRRLGYLKTAKRLGLHPSEWMLRRVPILPPRFRPISLMAGTGVPLVADINYLYKELIEADKNLAAMKKVVGDANLADERLAVYQAFKAVTGLGDPISQSSRAKDLRGLLASVFGSTPKFSCFDDATEILTESGWVRFAQLKPSMKVATLNPRTGAFEWQLPEKILVYDYRGIVFHFRVPHVLDLVITPEHRNWVRTAAAADRPDDMTSGWHMEKAYELASAGERRWMRSAAATWTGRGKLPSWLPPGCTGESFAALVGWWLALGNLAHKPRTCVRLRCRAGQKALCRTLDRVCAATGFDVVVGEGCEYRGESSGKYTRESAGRVLREWLINCRPLARWLLRHASMPCGTRRLSREILDWPVSWLRALLSAYLQSGAVPSAQLAEQLQEVACKAGISLRIARIVSGSKVREDKQAIIEAGSPYVSLVGREAVKTEWYFGKVYCVSVPNSIVYVRRNGRPVFSGNSMQRKLLTTTVDNVGRAVITPNPDLDMDTVGLPEDRAYDVYARYVVRRLRRAGVPALEALRQVKERTPLAHKALLEEMQVRPVLINRAPVLHKFGILAFKPVLVKGSTLQVSPLIVKGFNADFDGDAMQYHVPASDEACKEALEVMLPSRQLLSPADFKTPVHMPIREYAGGLYAATTTKSSRRPRVFRNADDVRRAWERGDISIGDPVEILEPLR